MLMYEKIHTQLAKIIKDSEDKPVAVYCTIQKKCVMVFRTNELSNKYVFNKLQYQNNRTRYLVNAKGKTSKNHFHTSLAFRYATPDQKYFLGKDEDIVIFDARFLRQDMRSKVCEQIS